MTVLLQPTDCRYISQQHRIFHDKVHYLHGYLLLNAHPHFWCLHSRLIQPAQMETGSILSPGSPRHLWTALSLQNLNNQCIFYPLALILYPQDPKEQTQFIFFLNHGAEVRALEPEVMCASHGLFLSPFLPAERRQCLGWLQLSGLGPWFYNLACLGGTIPPPPPRPLW